MSGSYKLSETNISQSEEAIITSEFDTSIVHTRRNRDVDVFGIDNEAVEMRHHTVHPSVSYKPGISSLRSERSKNESDPEHQASDSADGDALNPENFAPLLSTNQFTIRKTAAQALMDVALMMANISQLRTLITAGPESTDYFYPLVTLVVLSLAAQIIFAGCIFVIWVKESNFEQREGYLATLKEVESKGGLPKRTTDNVRVSLMRREEAYKEHRLTSHLNYGTMVLVFCITVINMFITGFGIKLHKDS